MAAPTLLQLFQPNAAGDRLWITDKTGEYDAATNLTGHGTPNKELAEHALVALIVRKAIAGDQQNQAVGSRVIYDAGAANTKETIFEFYHINDGSHEGYLMEIAASNDGVNDLDTVDGPTALIEGQYFYNTAQSAIYQIVAAAPVLVAPVDYVDMIDDATVVAQTLCREFFPGQMAILRAQFYQDYQATRKGPCDEDPKFNKTRLMSEDIASAVYTFWSGLTVESQRQAETILEEYNIDDLTNGVS